MPSGIHSLIQTLSHETIFLLCYCLSLASMITLKCWELASFTAYKLHATKLWCTEQILPLTTNIHVATAKERRMKPGNDYWYIITHQAQPINTIPYTGLTDGMGCMCGGRLDRMTSHRTQWHTGTSKKVWVLVVGWGMNLTASSMERGTWSHLVTLGGEEFPGLQKLSANDAYTVLSSLLWRSCFVSAWRFKGRQSTNRLCTYLTQLL